MECGNASRAQELEMVERRHKEALLALKSMHMDELQAVKQRAKVRKIFSRHLLMKHSLRLACVI